jgi:hypothetical protein
MLPRATLRAARLLLLASGVGAPLLSLAEEPRPEMPAAAEAPRPAAPPSLAPRLTPPAAAAPAPARAEAEKGKAEAPAAASVPAAGGAAPAGPVLTVAELTEDTVRLAGPNVGLAPKQVGRVVGRDGATVGRVVIDRVLENGAVAKVVSGRENVSWGLRVRFDPPPKR